MVKNLPANTRDAGLIPRLGDPREGNGIVVYIFFRVQLSHPYIMLTIT